MLPKRLQAKIWGAYVPGQEITKTPSDAYLDVANEVQEWIKALPQLLLLAQKKD